MKNEKIYMNIKTGKTGTFDEWWYNDEYGTPQNAVKNGEAIEVYKVHGEWKEVK